MVRWGRGEIMETLTVLCKRPVGVGEDKAGQKEAETKADGR